MFTNNCVLVFICMYLFVCVLLSLLLSAMSRSVICILVFRGQTHLLFFTFVDNLTYCNSWICKYH